MAIKIKSAGEIAKKYAEVTPARAKIWEEEIKATPDSDWEEPAKRAAPTWEAGVSDAIGRGAFAKGVEGSGPKWKRKALATGPTRYGPGVRAAQPDYAEGFAPYRETIAALTLTPKGPRGAPGNYERVREVGEALHNKRVGG